METKQPPDGTWLDVLEVMRQGTVVPVLVRAEKGTVWDPAGLLMWTIANLNGAIKVFDKRAFADQWTESSVNTVRIPEPGIYEVIVWDQTQDCVWKKTVRVVDAGEEETAEEPQGQTKEGEPPPTFDAPLPSAAPETTTEPSLRIRRRPLQTVATLVLALLVLALTVAVLRDGPAIGDHVPSATAAEASPTPAPPNPVIQCVYFGRC